MCLYPKLIKNRKYTMNKKNGGIVPPITDKRVIWVPVGCGKCIECRKQKAREWQVRLLEDVRHNKDGKFITLTFSNESIKDITEGTKDKDGAWITEPIKGLEGYDLDNEIATIAMRRFLERWRKKYKKSIRHWMVTELGGNGTENIHMHGIMWGGDVNEIEKIWQYGFVWKGKEDGKGGIINYVNEKTVNYITKYINKVDEKHEYYKPKILTSPGIGKGYLDRSDSERNKYNGENTEEAYKSRTGHKIAMPIYWRNKIYNDEEKEKLWLQKLDKQERWVCGERVDVSNGEEEYNQLVRFYRQKNKRLGYGNDEVNYDKKRYENTLRKLKIEKRIKGK